jgi:hypothetical protein
VIGKESFSPLTGSDGGCSYTTEGEGAGPANATESSEHSPVSGGDDQESPPYSPVSGDDQDSPESETEQMSQEVTGSSEYSPVSDTSQTSRQRDGLWKSRQRPRQRICVWPKPLRRSQVATRVVDDVVDPVLWTMLTSSKSDLGDGGSSTDHEHQQQSDTAL